MSSNWCGTVSQIEPEKVITTGSSVWPNERTCPGLMELSLSVKPILIPTVFRIFYTHGGNIVVAKIILTEVHSSHDPQ